MFVTVVRHPNGPRLFIGRRDRMRRMHHGTTGIALLACAILSPKARAALAGLGIFLAVHDRRDWRGWSCQETLLR